MYLNISLPSSSFFTPVVLTFFIVVFKPLQLNVPSHRHTTLYLLSDVYPRLVQVHLQLEVTIFSTNLENFVPVLKGHRNVWTNVLTSFLVELEMVLKFFDSVKDKLVQTEL